MATGYTHDVANGEVTDLKTFAMHLARGMGALVMMRDDPADAPIPEAFEPSDYHAKKLVEARAERDRLYAMSADEAQAAADAERAENVAVEAKAREKHAATRARYQAMIDKVEAWDGAPEGIKEFGLDQLKQSIDFDCREPFKFYLDPVPADGKEWLSVNLDKAEWLVAYHLKEDAQERSRTDARNAWLAQLRRSLEGAE